MTTTPPAQLFAFSGQVAQGDRLDAQFANHATAITSTQTALADVRRSDGALKNGIVTQDSLAPGLLAELTQDVADQVAPSLAAAQGASANAILARNQAENARDQAQIHAVTAQQARNAVEGSAGSVLAQSTVALQTVQNLYSAAQALIPALQNSENDAIGAAAEASEWADVSYHWAEYTSGTIPPNILATMGITGDHWSARWWANNAAQTVQNWEADYSAGLAGVIDFNKRYLGGKPVAPSADNNGDDLEPGALYWNTATSQFFVWTGSMWTAVVTGGGGGGGGGAINVGTSLGTGAAVYAGVLGDTLRFRSLKFSSSFVVTTTGNEIQIDIPPGGGVAWSSVTGKPTTISGYGITDAYTKTEVNSALALKADTSSVNTALALKADTSTVNSALALKADTSTVNTALAGKSNTGHTHTFVGGLSDAPASYSGQANKFVRVNAGANGLEFADPSLTVGDGTLTPAKLSPGKPIWDTSGNLLVPSSLTMGGNILSPNSYYVSSYAGGTPAAVRAGFLLDGTNTRIEAYLNGSLGLTLHPTGITTPLPIRSTSSGEFGRTNASEGYVLLQSGGPSHGGFVGFFRANDTYTGYIGYTDATGQIGIAANAGYRYHFYGADPVINNNTIWHSGNFAPSGFARVPTTSGIGQWSPLRQATALPPGGTWAYVAWPDIGFGPVMTEAHAGIAAGGSNPLGAMLTGFCWRIA